MSQVEVRLEGMPEGEEGTPEPPWLEDCRRFASAALRELGGGDRELSILFCGDPFIRELNRRYRGLDTPTDVLSFAQDGPASGSPGAAGSPAGAGAVAGDIVISLDTLARNAQREGESREKELKRLLIHGMLHLQGLDHPEEGESEMLRLQEDLLERLGGKRIGL